MIKVLERTGIQETYLNIIKGNIQQANSQHQTKWTDTVVPLQSGTGQGFLLFEFLFNVVLRS